MCFVFNKLIERVSTYLVCLFTVAMIVQVNASNIKNIIPELFAENLIRGRGLFARSCMKSQMASPTFTHVFAALVAVVNTKFPELGELLLKRIILQLRRAFKRNDKQVLLAAAKFVAHLVNQQVAHEIISLELLTLLLEKPTDDSVEVSLIATKCAFIVIMVIMVYDSDLDVFHCSTV